MQGGEVVLFHTQPRGNSIDHLRIYHCRVDRIYSDALRGVLQRSGLGETDHGVLRRNINAYVWKADQSGHRSAVDDGTTASISAATRTSVRRKLAVPPAARIIETVSSPR